MKFHDAFFALCKENLGQVVDKNSEVDVTALLHNIWPLVDEDIAHDPAAIWLEHSLQAIKVLRRQKEALSEDEQKQVNVTIRTIQDLGLLDSLETVENKI